MKNILATVITFCFLGNAVIADVIEGEFSCKVLSASITAVEEGKVKKCSGHANCFITYDDFSPFGSMYSNGMDVGDELFLVYRLGKSYYPSFDLDITYNPYGDLSNRIAYYKGTFEAQENSFSVWHPNTYYTVNEENDMSFSVVYLHRDKISLTGMYDIDGQQFLNLERYYKDDWQGIIVQSSGVSVSVATVDCSHPISSYDKVIDFLRYKFD